MHEVGHARDRLGRERKPFHHLGIRAARSRNRNLLRVVEVVRQPDRDAALLRRAERATDDLDEIRGQVEVVHGDLERLLRRGEEISERVCGLLGRLAAVDQRVDFDASHSAL